MQEELKAVAEAVEKGKAKLIPGLVQAALDAGIDATEILNTGMIGAMDVVGEKFKNNEIFVPEMLVAARAMKKGVEVLKPHLATGAAGKCRQDDYGYRSGRTFMISARTWLS